jgi:hypothetical protein
MQQQVLRGCLGALALGAGAVPPPWVLLQQVVVLLVVGPTISAVRPHPPAEGHGSSSSSSPGQIQELHREPPYPAPRPPPPHTHTCCLYGGGRVLGSGCSQAWVDEQASLVWMWPEGLRPHGVAAPCIAYKSSSKPKGCCAGGMLGCMLHQRVRRVVTTSEMHGAECVLCGESSGWLVGPSQAVVLCERVPAWDSVDLPRALEPWKLC